jgi:hypothetical protein
MLYFYLMQDTSFLKHLFSEGLYAFPEEKQAFVVQAETVPTVQTPSVEDILSTQTTEAASAPPSTPVVPDVSQPKVHASATPASNYLQEGNFAKKILVLSGWLSLEDREFLLKILGAVQLGMQDIYLQQHGDASIDLQALTHKIQPAYLLAFGIKRQLHPPVPVTEYIPMPSAKTTVLFADDLASIATQVELKRKLWSNLQQLFSKKG